MICSLDFFPTSLCGVLVLLAAIPPDSVLPSLLRPSLLRLSLTHAIILSSDLFPSHTIISSSSHLFLSFLSLSLILFHSLSSPLVDLLALFWHLTVTHTHNHLVALIHSQNFIYSPFLSHLTPAVAGVVSRDCMQKGLRRALSPLGARLSPQWPAQSPETVEGAAARVVAAGSPALSAVAGAVSRDCRRGCGARCRRWGPGSLRSGRRSLQSALSPLGARLSLQWPAQCPETAEGAAARVVAAGGPALSAVAGAVSRDCRRLRRALSPLGARLSPQWPAQCPETVEGAAARVVAAGGSALSAVAGVVVSRDCSTLRSGRRSLQRLQQGCLCAPGCGARCRRWGAPALRVAL